MGTEFVSALDGLGSLTILRNRNRALSQKENSKIGVNGEG